MAVIPFSRRNTLAYPAGNTPGIDPSHPAARGLRFSGVALGGNIVSLTQGRIGTIAGAPTFGLDGSMGPTFITSAGVQSASFSGQSATVDANVTMAAIVKFNAASGLNVVFFTSKNVFTGVTLERNGTTLNLVDYANGSVDAVITLTADVPYFIIASGSASATNFLVRRLDTGQTITSTKTGLVFTTSNGTYTVGDDGFGDGANAKIAAVMFAANFMSLAEMNAWAKDPWAFWYPQPAMSKIAVPAAGGSFLAAWARNSNLPVIGTGTY